MSIGVYMTKFYFIRIFLILELFSGTQFFAYSTPAKKEKCKWNTQLSQAFQKYENYQNGQYEADDADILLPLGNQKMNCVLDSMIKKGKYDLNPDVLLWLTFIPDSVFYLSPASIKYLVDNKDAYLKNAARMLINEKQNKKYSIDKKIIKDNKTAKEFLEYLIYEYRSNDDE